MSYTVKQLSPIEKNIDIRDIAPYTNDHCSLLVFDELVVEFLNDFSRQIMLNKNINKIPAITALAFWLRRANIKELINENNHIVKNNHYQANSLGTVFHVCPANVDTMFLYSLTVSLLVGNKNIVRVSKKSFHPNILELFLTINQLLKNSKYDVLKKYICILSYGHEIEINEYISENCDARIIWGGDNTINLFKKFKTQSRTKDIVFADRISYSIINVDEYLKIDHKSQQALANNFFNDAYTFDQKGCSSPQLIFLYGNKNNADYFIPNFYKNISLLAENTYKTDIYSLSSLKLNALVTDIIDKKTDHVVSCNNYVTFANFTKNNLGDHACGGGYFYYKHIVDLDEIKTFVDKKTQTLSYFGFNETEISQLVSASYNKGIDRIVPIGKALAFSYIWDGYNLIDELVSKKSIIKE